MLTANRDGSDICLVNDHDQTSHCCWMDDSHILGWAHRNNCGDDYFIFHDRTPKVEWRVAESDAAAREGTALKRRVMGRIRLSLDSGA